MCTYNNECITDVTFTAIDLVSSRMDDDDDVGERGNYKQEVGCV